MADDVRQKLVDLVEARFQTITTGNGYETNIGNSVTVWRDFENVPLPDSALDAVNIRDARTESSKDGEALTRTRHELQFECQVSSKDTSAARDVKIRKMLADIVKAIGTDRYWTDSGTEYAADTRIENTDMEVLQAGEVIGGAQIVFTIIFRTDDFDPYTPRN